QGGTHAGDHQLHDRGQAGGTGDCGGGADGVDIHASAEIDDLIVETVAVVKQEQFQLIERGQLEVLASGHIVVPGDDDHEVLVIEGDLHHARGLGWQRHDSNIDRAVPQQGQQVLGLVLDDVRLQIRELGVHDGQQ